MPSVIDDGIHCARCQEDLKGSESTAYGYKVCIDCAKVFKFMSRNVPEWELFDVYFSYIRPN